MRLLPILAILIPPLVVACTIDGSGSCTMMSCSQGVAVDFAEARVGT